VDATSTEFNRSTKSPLIGLITEWLDERGEVQQRSVESDLGGTMRLGGWDCEIKEGTKAFDIYQNTMINERHRHRYEFNNYYTEAFEKAGMVLSGVNPETKLVEIIELPNHPFFVAAQYHPEYKSTVANPHPLFSAFVKAAVEKKVNV
ncbi:MAG: CTP synthase, partial [Myroides sp.]